MVAGGLAGSVLVHVGVVAALLLLVRGESRSGPPTYAVTLVAAPLPAGGARPSPELVTPPPAPAPPKAAAKRPAPKPVAKKPAAKAPAKATPTTGARSQVTPLPGEKPGTGNDIANVDLKGKEFPYPEYLRNLVSQIYRRWNRPAGNLALEAEVAFIILRDGTVKDIKLVRSSRSYSFDQEAQGAIETAAGVRAFGPLPTGYGADYLRISFLFTPRQLP